ncbi:MAG: hypothetical protein WC365_08245 [Candidatus Babeliales bacterium]|jgi:hypothetical protein
MTNDEFEKRYQTSVLMAGRELALLRKVNTDLLEALEKISNTIAIDGPTPIYRICITAINHAANDMRFGITEKKP